MLSYNKFRAGAAWLILFLGIVLYIVGFVFITKDDNEVWHEIFLKLGDVLVIGVIIGYLSNAAQFLGVFKKDLQDIILGKEYVKQLKDIYPFWENISKEMFKNKFPAIHRDFLKAIDGYFPKNDVLYFNDYETSMIIEWENKDKNIIKVSDVTSYDIITETNDEIDFPVKTWTVVDNIDAFKTSIDYFRVNEEDKELKLIKSSVDDYGKREEFNVKLKGATKYSIKQKKTKIYNLEKDYIIGFRAAFIVNNYRIRIDYPEDINLLFTCRGTQNDFEDMNSKNHSLEKKYKGVLLPRQGFVCGLQKK